MRGNDHCWYRFQVDCRHLGLTAQRHYQSRSTFRSLALANGADGIMLNPVTHLSEGEASDFYNRIGLLWPRLCQTVECVHRRASPDAPRQARGREVAPSPCPLAQLAGTSAGSPLNSAAAQQNHGGGPRESNPPKAPFSTLHRF